MALEVPKHLGVKLNLGVARQWSIFVCLLENILCRPF